MEDWRLVGRARAEAAKRMVEIIDTRMVESGLVVVFEARALSECNVFRGSLGLSVGWKDRLNAGESPFYLYFFRAVFKNVFP